MEIGFSKYAVLAVVMYALYLAIPTTRTELPLSFDVPEQTAIERLAKQSRVVEGSGLGSLTINSVGRSGNSLLIGIRKAGEPRTLKCRVDIDAVSAMESRAEVDCAQPASGKEPLRAVAANAFEIVVREHVAATIGQRPYDIDDVADRMISFWRRSA